MELHAHMSVQMNNSKFDAISIVIYFMTIDKYM